MASRKHTTPTQLDLGFGPPEEWRAIPGYEGLYEVSNLGRVRGVNRVEDCGDRRRRRHGRIRKPETSFGYKRIALSINGKKSKVMVHVVVLSAFVGTRPEGFQVNHLDGNKANNVLHNLEWVTGSENQRHAVAMGLKRIGEHHHQAKLTEEQVREIRALDAQGARSRDLARTFGVAYGTMRGILTGRIWRHLL